MKIAMVLPWPVSEPGGVNEVVKNLRWQWAKRSGVHSMILVNEWAARRARIDIGREADTWRLRLRAPVKPWSPAVSVAAFVADLPRMLYWLRRLLNETGASAVNIHYPTNATFVLGLMRALGMCPGPLVLSFHGTDLREVTSAGRLERAVWRATLRWADAITVCSEHLCSALLSVFPEARGKTKVILNGLDPEYLHEERNAWLASGGHPIPFDRPFVLSVGNFVAVKAQEILVSAFARVAAEERDVQLVVAGRAGPAHTALEEQIARLGLSERVTLLVDEPHPRIMDLCARARVFALSSEREGLPVVLLEAGSAGIPVVATAVGGVPELIQPGVTGLLVDTGQPEALAAALLTLLRDTALADKLGRALKRRVETGFTWCRAAESYMELLRGVPPARTGLEVSPARAPIASRWTSARGASRPRRGRRG
jgi:glycosyltransferase involved in cell wall biosynthesis